MKILRFLLCLLIGHDVRAHFGDVGGHQSMFQCKRCKAYFEDVDGAWRIR